MARDKKPPDPPVDIPAWFMTYSDVITLLMTFFILLLTFATTEPERFEKSTSVTFSSGSGTGTAGKKMKSMDNESWTRRIRPNSARIAMRGAEMPAIIKDSAAASFGEGMKALTEEEKKQNELTSHSFDIPAIQLFDSKGNLTMKGQQICRMLSNQLRDLPFQASIQYRDKAHADNLAAMMEHLFHTEKTRPGQLAMTVVKTPDLNPKNIRIIVKRFSSPRAEQVASQSAKRSMR